jgi:hypothetical protein
LVQSKKGCLCWSAGPDSGVKMTAQRGDNLLNESALQRFCFMV